MDDRIRKKIKEKQLNYAFIKLCNIFDLKHKVHKRSENDRYDIAVFKSFLVRFSQIISTRRKRKI